MPGVDSTSLPEFREWSIAAVHLLRGVVYNDDSRAWDLVLAWKSALESHFGRLGLMLVIDEPEGFAYLRQLSEEECPTGYERIPKLVRKTRLGYDATLLCVLLREELRRFEEEEVHDERCVIELSPLFDDWKTFFPPQQDEVKSRKELAAALRKLDELGFIRQFCQEPESWEIRRILKARLSAAELEQLRAALATAGKGETEEKTAEAE